MCSCLVCGLSSGCNDGPIQLKGKFVQRLKRCFVKFVYPWVGFLARIPAPPGHWH